ncbi:hypothetical protein CbuD7D7780_11725 (plasmid) [Coxiella burnetii]|uniref:YdhG-like domain-containing protein n=2 Tax=Coxiella burnetii TaxID=777 RepID=A9KH50_COXBN|nr:hypothetical protein CBUD_A0020 [Coxiella burnetii Dugway 5J108-111]OYK81234.1 hypothetical protein CbuD7D7780_11725 [Coxiella burnetii]
MKFFIRKAMVKHRKFQCRKVQEKFENYPQSIKPRLLFLREFIFKVASQTAGVGDIEETLKWGEPSYVTSQTKSGSTIRIDWKKSTPNQYYIYFNCKTTLVDTFKEIYDDLFTYGGNRSLIFQKDDKLPVDELSDCIAMALTYHLTKKRR